MDTFEILSAWKVSTCGRLKIQLSVAYCMLYLAGIMAEYLDMGGASVNKGLSVQIFHAYLFVIKILNIYFRHIDGNHKLIQPYRIVIQLSLNLQYYFNL